MEFVPLLPDAIKDGDAGKVTIQADGHHATFQLPVKDKHENDTSITPDAAIMEPAQQRMILPRVRLDDYYSVRIIPLHTTLPQTNRTYMRRLTSHV